MNVQRAFLSSLTICLASATIPAVGGDAMPATGSSPLPVEASIKCEDELVKIPKSNISELRLLSREMDNDLFKHTRILTFPVESRIWQTKCPVTLDKIGDETSRFCQRIPIFGKNTKIRIAPLLDGRYLLHAENLNFPHSGNLGALLVPHTVEGSSSGQRHVGWLKSETSTLPDFDFYVLMSTREANVEAHDKHFQIEAFHRNDTTCDAHRPDKSLCMEEEKRSDNPERQRCPRLRQDETTFTAFETHTGGGNENVGIP